MTIILNMIWFFKKESLYLFFVGKFLSVYFVSGSIIAVSNQLNRKNTHMTIAKETSKNKLMETN